MFYCRISYIIGIIAVATLVTLLIYMPKSEEQKTPLASPISKTDATQIIFLGDTMLGRIVDKCIAKNPPEFVWGDTLPILKSADAVIDNLEAVIAKGGTPWMPKKVFYFKADPKAIDVLKAANVTYVTNANNHAMDYDREALVEMLGHLDKAGIAHSGAGRNLGEAMQPAFIDAGPLKLAVIAWTNNEPDWLAGEDVPGVHHLQVNDESLVVLSEQIADVRAKGADFVIIAAHWGPNMVEYPPEYFQTFARGLIDAGADIFYGHSSHVFQGVEAYKSKLIMYDTGDFVDDYAINSKLRNDMSFIFKVHVDASGLQKLEMIPVLINGQAFCQVNLAHGKLAEEIIGRMKKRSEPFGTEFEDKEEAIILKLR